MTHELSPSVEQSNPPSAGEAWQQAAEMPGIEEIRLTQTGTQITLLGTEPLHLPELLDKIDRSMAQDPLAVIYAGNPRTPEGTPQKSWDRGNIFVVYGQSQQIAHTGLNGEATKVAMRSVPRVFQIDTQRGTTAYVGDVEEDALTVGRNTLPLSRVRANNDMSRIHFTLDSSPEGLVVIDHSANGTSVLRAEQLAQTREYTAAHDLGQTVITEVVES